MAKLKPSVTLQSYGIYSTWDSSSKALLQIEQFTTDVIAEIDVEFGLIVNIKKAKGEKLYFCIYHPDIPALFQVLQDVNVRMIAYGGSNNNISLLVNTSDKLETLQKLQRYVFETQPQFAALNMN